MLSLRESGASCYTSATMTARPVVMIACICLLLAVFLSPAAAQVTGGVPGTYRATIAGHKVLLPSVTFDGVPFVSARALAAALGGKATPGKRPGDLTLDLSGHGLAFSADDLSLVRLESGATSMLTEARPIGGDLYVPTEFIARVIAPLLEERPPAEGGRLDLQVIGGEGTLRLAFQCPRPIRHELKDEGGVLLLVMSGPSMLPPFQTRWLGSTLVREISFETRPGALVARMEKGEGYLSASATSVRDPGGVVVDVRGSASVQRRAPTGGLAMAGELGPVTASEPPPSAALAPAAHAGRRQLEKVVLDPGHGGQQKGAEGKDNLLEKEITLDIAQRLQKLLRGEGLDAVLTRNTDADLSLVERTAAANREKGDLFVSIHVNSATRKDARGAETYYLAYQTADQDASDLAASENAEPAPSESYDPSGAGLVLWDLAQAEHLRDSAGFAEIAQRELNEALEVRERGVKQAPFRVLMGATMPAVLVEVGFISNPVEQTALKSDEYKDKIAGALLRSILEFKRTFDRK